MKFFTVFTALVATALAAPAADLETRDLEKRQTANDFVRGPCKSVIMAYARGSTELGNVGSKSSLPQFSFLSPKLTLSSPPSPSSRTHPPVRPQPQIPQRLCAARRRIPRRPRVQLPPRRLQPAGHQHHEEPHHQHRFQVPQRPHRGWRLLAGVCGRCERYRGSR